MANQNPSICSEEIHELILKCIWKCIGWLIEFKQNLKRKCIGSRIAKIILKEKKNNLEDLYCLIFKTYYKSTEVKTVWFWQESIHIDHWNRESRN